jgi:hypothetical protein
MCRNAETDAMMGRNLVTVAMDFNFFQVGGIFRLEAR